MVVYVLYIKYFKLQQHSHVGVSSMSLSLVPVLGLHDFSLCTFGFEGSQLVYGRSQIVVKHLNALLLCSCTNIHDCMDLKIRKSLQDGATWV